MARTLQQGFSLIEMIVVLVIIGMIAGLVINNVGGRADKAKWDAAKGQITMIQTGVEAFRLDVGRLPDSLSDLVEQPGDAEFWAGPYVRKSLLKDPWSNDWIYNADSADADYELKTYAKDKSAGGSGTSRDIDAWE